MYTGSISLTKSGGTWSGSGYLGGTVLIVITMTCSGGVWTYTITDEGDLWDSGTFVFDGSPPVFIADGTFPGMGVTYYFTVPNPCP